MREKLGSRFGFLMLAAGCAVGLGNVWRFPFIVGQNGGAAFVAVYLLFLVILGFPLLVAELAIGRNAKSGISSALPKLAKRNNNFWRIAARIIFAGNFVLMIYYTDVAGWLVKYSCDYLSGGINLADGETFAVHFSSVTADSMKCGMYMVGVVAAATLVCLMGVVKGVERVTKILMISLLTLLCILAFKSLSLPNAAEGLKFYLYPDWAKFMEHPWRGIMEAMGQAFFTLSLGIGCMTIFGSYIERRHSLVKEAALIIVIDTIVALLSGLIVFPVCLSYGVEPSSGPGLIFIAIPEVFSRIAGGAFWGFCFFLFLAFAAFTTIIAVFECLIGGLCDEFVSSSNRSIVSSLHRSAVSSFHRFTVSSLINDTNDQTIKQSNDQTIQRSNDPTIQRSNDPTIQRSTVSLMVGVMVAVAALPCVIWDKVLNWEDFAVSQIWLPLGALMQCIFVAWGVGWGWRRFQGEASWGSGPFLPTWARPHMRYVIPLLILAVIIVGLAAK